MVQVPPVDKDFNLILLGIKEMATSQSGDTLVENPAWRVARAALQTMETPAQPENGEEALQQNPNNQPYYNQQMGQRPPPMQFNYNHGYNAYPRPVFRGAYNQR